MKKFNDVTAKANQLFGKTIFNVKKHSPEILIVAGVIGTVSSTIMACRATTKLSTILEDTKTQAEAIHEYMDRAKEGTVSTDYSESDGEKDLRLVYFQTAMKVAKLYAPSVILGTLSLTSVIASNNILRKRNVALAAAYATIEKSFKEYRGRVVDRFGADVDQELRYNIKSKVVEETTVDSKGKEKKVKKTVKVADPNLSSDYAMYFTKQTSAYCEDNWGYNMNFLVGQEKFWNYKLQSKGAITLNEVYEALGIEPTKAGMVVGWVYDVNNTDGDNCIDFGIHDVYLEDTDSPYKRTIILDFNVDGNIYNKVK